MNTMGIDFKYKNKKIENGGAQRLTYNALNQNFVKLILDYVIERYIMILNNAPKLSKDVFAFRGIRTRRNTTDVMQRFNGFNSFSLDPCVGEGFRGLNGSVYRILIQKGTPLLYLSNSKFPIEVEVLLPTNGIFYKQQHNCGSSVYIDNFEVLYQSHNAVDKKVKLLKGSSILPMTYIWSKNSLYKKYNFLNK